MGENMLPVEKKNHIQHSASLWFSEANILHILLSFQASSLVSTMEFTQNEDLLVKHWLTIKIMYKGDRFQRNYADESMGTVTR